MGNMMALCADHTQTSAYKICTIFFLFLLDYCIFTKGSKMKIYNFLFSFLAWTNNGEKLHFNGWNFFFSSSTIFNDEIEIGALWNNIFILFLFVEIRLFEKKRICIYTCLKDPIRKLFRYDHVCQQNQNVSDESYQHIKIYIQSVFVV